MSIFGKFMRVFQIIAILLVLSCLSMLSGCRWIKMTPDPIQPKQGDIVKVKITVGESEDLTKVNYNINGVPGTATSVPHTVSVNICKESGQYPTTLSLWGEAIYNDGETITIDSALDLTVGKISREDGDLNYAIYVAQDNDGDTEDLMIDMANAFMDEFNSYSQSQYYWAEPRFYTTQSLFFANSADLVISFGHGNHHHYRAGNSGSHLVNVSTTAYGNCAPCYNTGDLEYLVFASCQILSIDNYGAQSFWYYWFNNASTKLDKRPFTGLHATLGFRTNFTITFWEFLWWSGNDGDDFFDEFADNLDDGMRVIDAWQEAIGDELSFDDGNNRGAVIYLKQYEDDAISTAKDDYIYGNSNYSQQWIDYWE